METLIIVATILNIIYISLVAAMTLKWIRLIVETQIENTGAIMGIIKYLTGEEIDEDIPR